MLYDLIPLGDTPHGEDRGDTMARPNKIGDKTKSYNLTVSVADYNELDKFATRESDRYAVQVSVADLIRNAIKLYLEDLRIADNDERNKD